MMNYDLFCNRCKNYESNLTHGVICGLTGEKPDFEGDCPEFVLEPAKEQTSPVFFPLSQKKLLIMCFSTLGIYAVYWFYRNWKYLAESDNQDVNAFARTFFLLLFCYSLFKRIRIRLDAEFSTGWLAAGFIIFFFGWNGVSEDPSIAIWATVSNLMLLPIQEAINRFNVKLSSKIKIDDSFTNWNIAGMVFGGLAWLGLLSEM